MILRDYQKNGSDAVFEQWKDSTSTLVVMPTGTGKTILFADIIRRVHPQRSIVVAHREELIWQARDKIMRTTGLNCEIEMAHLAVQPNMFNDANVVVTTVQTQCAGGNGNGRMTRFDPMEFGLLIIDEAHHATADSYRKVIDYYRQNPDLKVLGVTATPDRTDEEALGQIFDTVAFDYEILDAIHDGWLVPIDQQMVCIEGLDFSNVKTTAGDLNGADLAAVMEAEKNLQGIAGSSIKIIGDRRSIVFTASVKHAEMMCEIFNRHKPDMAAWVSAKTNKDKRKEILADFASGRIQVVCNCGILTEGFDDPGVEVIIMGRPTKSRSLYSQMIGRSTRPLPRIVDGPATKELRKAAIAASNKPSCLVVDFVGNSGRHKLITSADILGGNVSDEAIERAIKTAKEKGAPVRMSDTLDEAQEKLKQEAEQRRQAEAARKARLLANVRYSTQTISPFDAFQLEPAKARGWDSGKSLSERQRNTLTKAGINPDDYPVSQAKQMVGEVIRRWTGKLCSLNQAKCLMKFGYDTKELSFAEASNLITKIKANNWRRPPEPPPGSNPTP